MANQHVLRRHVTFTIHEEVISSGDETSHGSSSYQRALDYSRRGTDRMRNSDNSTSATRHAPSSRSSGSRMIEYNNDYASSPRTSGHSRSRTGDFTIERTAQHSSAPSRYQQSSRSRAPSVAHSSFGSSRPSVSRASSRMEPAAYTAQSSPRSHATRGSRNAPSDSDSSDEFEDPHHRSSRPVVGPSSRRTHASSAHGTSSSAGFFGSSHGRTGYPGSSRRSERP